jgi:thiamine biosynthesis lipoprotein
MRGFMLRVAFAAVLSSNLLAGNWKLAAGSRELTRYESVEPHMGTLVKITVYTSGEDDARRAFRAGFDRIAALDAILSDYKPDSELNRIAGIAVGAPVEVSRDLFTVLEAARELAEATAGAFDVTQGPVIRLWREARRSRHVPDEDALREAASRTGYQKLHVDRDRCTVRLDQAGMALDVGGIAKGYAASEALAAITGLGVRSSMVAISQARAGGGSPCTTSPGNRRFRTCSSSRMEPSRLPAPPSSISTPTDTATHTSSIPRPGWD